MLLASALLLGSLPAPLAAAISDEHQERLIADLRRYFAAAERAGDPHELETWVERIRSNPLYERARMSEWLHRLDLYPALASGRHEIEVDVGFGHRRRITLRLPEDYDPARPWPLIYALHPSGGTGPAFLGQAERILGPLADDFVIAAPTHYRQTVLDAPPPFTAEHPIMLRELRRRVHLDSDRFYALGYSLGGYAAWTLALLHGDFFAGTVPISSAFSPPADVAGLWEAMAPNLAVPVLHVWGERDSLPVPGFEGRRHSGTMGELNRRFSPLIRRLGLDVVDHALPGAGHGGAQPPRTALERILENRRDHHPPRVLHRYRHLHQGRAHWLEARTWTGDHWGEPGRPIEPRRGESWPEAAGRTILPLLGELEGEIDGQTIRIASRHVGEVTLWIGEGMIDWRRPLRVERDGEVVFEGRVEPDLAVCLAEAARTRDFDRLRWAVMALR